MDCAAKVTDCGGLGKNVSVSLKSSWMGLIFPYSARLLIEVAAAWQACSKRISYEQEIRSGNRFRIVPEMAR